MNIFYLDHDVKKCAQMHNDKHCVKMILEYAQLLSTACRIIDGKETIGKSKTGRKVKRWVLDNLDREQIIYQATHINHPSAVWVRQSIHNYIWLSEMLLALLKEYTYRYGKKHKCELLGRYLAYPPINLPCNPFTQPTPAMPDDVKIAGDSIASYRAYYINNKAHLANWKNRPTPEWYKCQHMSS